MTTFGALLRRVPPASHFAAPADSIDPLFHSDALREAQLLDLRSECATMQAGVLLEMRMTEAAEEPRAALLVGRGVREADWQIESSSLSPRSGYSFGKAWNVAGSYLDRHGGILRLELCCIPNARLRISAEAFEFHLAAVPGLDAVPPDYGEGPDDVVRASLPDWDRPIKMVAAWRRDASD